MNKTYFLKMQKYIKTNDILSFDTEFEVEYISEFYAHDTLLSLSVIENRYEFIHFLLKNGADPNVLYLNDNSVLHYACQNSNINIVKLLCDYGANINSKNKHGNTPVWVAVHECKLRYFDIVEYLSTKSPLIDEKNKYGISVRERIIITENEKLIKLFNA